MELFAKIVNGFLMLTIFVKSYILDVWLSSDLTMTVTTWYEFCDISHITANKNLVKFKCSKKFFFPRALKHLRNERCLFVKIEDLLTLWWWRSLSYRNQSIDLLCKSMDWFLYNRDFRHEKVIEREDRDLHLSTNPKNTPHRFSCIYKPYKHTTRFPR